MRRLFSRALFAMVLFSSLAHSSGNPAVKAAPEAVIACSDRLWLVRFEKGAPNLLQKKVEATWETVRSISPEMGDPTSALSFGPSLSHLVEGSSAEIRALLTQFEGYEADSTTVVVSPAEVATSVVVHDFRNRLHNVIAILEKLRPSLNKPGLTLTEAIRKDLAEVKMELSASVELLKTLQDPERLMVAKPVEFDASLVLQQLRIYTRHMAPEVQVTIEIPEKPVILRADVRRIDNALYNLCLNAYEFIRKGGDGKIVVRMHVDAEARTVRLSVTDNGPGITPEQVQTILKPGGSSKGKGRGLGLSSAQSAADHFEIDSAPGRGTTMTLVLVDQPLKRVAPDMKLPVLDGPTILVVDDNKTAISQFEMLAQAMAPDLRFYSTRNGDEAILLAQTYPGKIKLAFLDLGDVIDRNGNQIEFEALMNGMLYADPGVRRIFASGKVSNGPLPLNVDGILGKPWNLDQVIELFGQTATWTRSESN